MSNFFLTNTNENKFDDIITQEDTNTTSTIDDNALNKEYVIRVIKTLNNFPLCNNNVVCDDILDSMVDDVLTTSDTIVTDTGTTTTTNTGNTTIINNITNVNIEDTYELIYKNIKSYPSITDVSDRRYFIKTFSLPDGGTIVLTTDMRTKGIIISTLSGDVPDNIPLTKTTTITNGNIEVMYS